MFLRLCIVIVTNKKLYLQNSFPQKAFASFESDKKRTEGRQNADRSLTKT